MRSNMKSLAYAAMTAAIYYVLCVAIAPLSYGQVQCRISEVILLFCMHNTFAVYGYTLGCALANLTSPLGILDVIVGSLANLIVGTFARRSGKVVPTILFGTVFNGIVVGAELSIVYGSPNHFQYAFYQGITQAPIVSPAPNPARTMWSPRCSFPCLCSSSRSTGMEAEDRLPTLSRFVGNFSRSA